jgi:two-component system sensor histidine kinase TctE
VTATLVLATAVNLYLSFVSATSTSELITDRTLLASATSIAEAAHVDSNGMLLVDIPPAALEMFDTGHRDQVFYRVVTAWGSLAAGYPDLPKQGKLNTGENGIYRDLPVRALTLTHPIVGLSRDGAISVTVAVTQNSTRALRRSLWQSDIAKQLLLVALAGLVTIFGLQRGLAPVLNLRDAILNRSPDSLDPLPPDMVQSELRPLVYALNDQMAKVQSLVAAQKRFVSNAAHQLRTPLALLSTQASVALRERDAEKRDSTLQALNRSIRHVARLAGQLLTLSRAEPVNSRSRQDRVDLVAAAREALANHMGEALARGLDLGLEADVAVWVRGDAPMIREMVVNLIDNAVRYTPDNGIVTAAVREEQGKAVLPSPTAALASRLKSGRASSSGFIGLRRHKARAADWGFRSCRRLLREPAAGCFWAKRRRVGCWSPWSYPWRRRRFRNNERTKEYPHRGGHDCNCS